MPVRLKVCVVPAVPPALSVKVSVADLPPVAPGVNVSATVQVLLGAVEPMDAPFVHVVPEPLTMAKSPTLVPLNATVARARDAVPELVRVTVCTALVTLWISFPNATVVVGFRVAAGAVPVPDSGTFCGLPLASSETEMLALRPPVADGVKVTAIVHVPPEASTTAEADTQLVTPEPLGVTRVKSPAFVPVSVTPPALMVSGPVPEFVRTVLDCALVVLISWPANVMDVGLKLTPGVVPVPERVMT